MIDATPNQLAYISKLLDPLPDDDDKLAYAEVIADYDRPPSKQWASQAIDELKVKAAIAQDDGNDQPADKGRLAPTQSVREKPTARIQRIYRVAWSLRGMSPAGFDKRWAEIGDKTRAFHGHGKEA